MRAATFVLSTGRCGTQWLALKLKSVYGDLLSVEHEPLHNGYEPRRMLGLKSPTDLGPDAGAVILGHAEDIERRLETQPYIECGHPCWGAMPWLAQRFAGRVRIIHLFRHPIPTALSWLTHTAYEKPFLPYLQEKILVSPFDEGVAFPEYRENWSTLSAFEKCLYYWAEVNALGLDLESTAGLPWLRVSYEELFTPPGIAKVLGFVDLPPRAGMIEAAGEVIDEHRFKSASPFPDLEVVSRHERVLEVAANLGYSTSWADVSALRQRYLPFGP